MRLKLQMLPGRFLIGKLPKETAVESGLPDKLTGSFVSVTETPEEVSIICEDIPGNQVVLKCGRVESGWAMVRVCGTLEFDQVGIIARLSGILADAGIPLFCISTFDTDYLLIRQNHVPSAMASWRQQGVTVLETTTPGTD